MRRSRTGIPLDGDALSRTVLAKIVPAYSSSIRAFLLSYMCRTRWCSYALGCILPFFILPFMLHSIPSFSRTYLRVMSVSHEAKDIAKQIERKMVQVILQASERTWNHFLSETKRQVINQKTAKTRREIERWKHTRQDH